MTVRSNSERISSRTLSFSSSDLHPTTGVLELRFLGGGHHDGFCTDAKLKRMKKSLFFQIRTMVQNAKSAITFEIIRFLAKVSIVPTYKFNF